MISNLSLIIEGFKTSQVNSCLSGFLTLNESNKENLCFNRSNATIASFLKFAFPPCLSNWLNGVFVSPPKYQKLGQILTKAFKLFINIFDDKVSYFSSYRWGTEAQNHEFSFLMISNNTCIPALGIVKTVQYFKNLTTTNYNSSTNCPGAKCRQINLFRIKHFLPFFKLFLRPIWPCFLQ